MKVAIVYGTRPEFLKLKVLIDKLKPVVIRINQHDHYTEDNGYYHHSINIPIINDRLSNIGSAILSQLPQLIENSTHIICQGDTASAFYSLLCAYQMKKICIHIEAGMRTYDTNNPWPEEAYRQMISRITDIHFCPSIYEAHCLGTEYVHGKIFIVGNTILDLVKSYNIPITQEKHVLITLHRRENWTNYQYLIEKLNKLANDNPEYKLLFITHPNPILKDIVSQYGKNLSIVEPLTHYNFIKLLASCSCVITDSGGIQEEANFLGKHIYVLRECTERKVIKNCTINPDVITLSMPQYDSGYEYGTGDSVEKILNHINNLE